MATTDLRTNLDKASVISHSSCGQCGKNDTDIKLQKCGRCHFQTYCGRDCQTKHWPIHKKVCQIQKTTPPSPHPASSNVTSPVHPGSAAQVNQAKQKIITAFPNIDRGIATALNAFTKVIVEAAKQQQGDLFLQFLNEIIFLDTEDRVIQLINSFDDEKQKLILQEHISIGPDLQKKFILCDLLRLTALQGRFSLLSHLLKRVSHYQLKHNDDKDRFGWNIAHFIALHSKDGKFPIINAPELDGLLDKKNRSGATPRDFVYWVSKPDPITVPVFGHEHPPLDPIQFKEQIGTNYWIRPCFTPGALLRTDFEECQIVTCPKYLSSLIGEKANRFIDDIKRGTFSFKIKIRKMNGPNFPIQMQGQWESLVSRDVKKGEILALYTGTVRHQFWDESNEAGSKIYGIADGIFIDPETGGGSLTEFINHGFPNCACFPHIYQGLPFNVVIALEDLPANTTLLLNYGDDYFKKPGITPITLNQNGLDAYLNATKMLKKIPFIEVQADGFSYCYADRGKILVKKGTKKLSEAEAIDAWSNKIKLEYLADYHFDELKTKLDFAFLQQFRAQ